MFKLVLEKAEEPEIKLPTSVGSLKKDKSSREASIPALLTMPKPWLCRSQQTLENSQRDGNTRPPHLPPAKLVCRSRSSNYNQTGSNGLALEKAEKPEIKLPTSAGSSKKQESSRKTSTFALFTMPKPLTVWITINCGKFFTNGNTRPPDLPPEKSVLRSKNNS